MRPELKVVVVLAVLTVCVSTPERLAALFVSPPYAAVMLRLPAARLAVLHVAELVDLAERGEDPGAVGAQLAVLDHHAELDREPEHA